MFCTLSSVCTCEYMYKSLHHRHMIGATTYTNRTLHSNIRTLNIVSAYQEHHGDWIVVKNKSNHLK